MSSVSPQAVISHNRTQPWIAPLSVKHGAVAGDRTIARVIGVLYLAGMVLGIGGNILIQSILTTAHPLPAIAASGVLLGIGAVGWLLTVAGDVAHGVLMFPILRRRSELSAVGYLAARIADGVLIAVMTLLIVAQVPVGAQFLKAGADAASLGALSAVLTEANLYAYDLAMASVGVAGLILCRAFLRCGLIPKPLALWGLAGYAIILVGSVVQVLGFELSSLHAILGGLWELFIGVWLIVKGFSTPETAPELQAGEGQAS